MRAEFNPAVIQFAQVSQRHHLKPAGIGKDRFLPVHEIMQPAQPADGFRTGPEHQVIGIGEYDFGTGPGDALRRHTFDGRRRADRHENRRLDRSMRGHQTAASCPPVRSKHLETETRHAPSARCRKLESP